MAVFSKEPEEQRRVDLNLLQNGPVALYFRVDILDEDLDLLRKLSYITDDFNCSTWQSENDFHSEMAVRLSFPNYYGRNLDALNDCIGDIDVPERGGRALVLRGFDSFARRKSQMAQVILDILALASWRYILFGRRLLTIVQSDDPRITFKPVGAHSVLWNPREWLDKSRGL